jgi:Type II secretion system (T2SS), protein E, N-terminal domain
MPPRKRLGQLLTELKVIDEHQLQSALGHQKQWGGKLGTILVQKGFCREDQMVSALSQHLGMPLVRLSDVKIDPRAVKTVSRSVAERLHVFAYEVTGSGRSEVITIAMSDPTDLSAIDQLAFHTGKRIKPILAGDSEVIAAIQQHYGSETPAKGMQPLPAGARPFVDGTPAAPGAVARPTPVAPMTPLPPAATPTPRFSGRVEPPRPPPPAMQAGAAAAAAGGNGAIAPVEPVGLGGEDLPADAPMEGLEPIAAHTQGAESVEGAEELAGQGTAADAVVGFEAANPPQEAGEVALETETAAPAAPPADGGWNETTAELPVDAIMGTAEVLETAPESAAQDSAAQTNDAPEAWSDIADPLAAAEGEGSVAPESEWAAAAAEVEAAAEEPSPAAGESLLEPPGDSPAPEEEVSIEAEGWSEEPGPAVDEAQADATAGQDVPFEMEQDAGVEAEYSRTQPQRWIPQADQDAGAEGEQVEEVPGGSGYEEGASAEQEFAEGAPADVGYGEAGTTEEPVQEEYGSLELAEEGQQAAEAQGWVASPEDQPQDAGWSSALSSTTPLSPADLGTLSALGLDPSDTAAAQRMLACLIRVLNRRQAIDVEELAAEIRESRLAGEAAVQALVDEQAALEERGATGMDAPAEEGAQTSDSGQDP